MGHRDETGARELVVIGHTMTWSARGDLIAAATLLLVVSSCAKRAATSDAAETVATAPSSVAAEPVAPSATVARAAASSPAAARDALGFKTMGNIEMVPYCLPYPSAYLTEDVSERWEHGRKVFRSRTTPPGGKPARMELAGSCGARSLEEIYEADRKNIQSEFSASAITVARLQRDSFVLSWRAADRIHYGKMWSAKNDPGCFVRATFEYGEAERSTFDTIIATVAAADPTCR